MVVVQPLGQSSQTYSSSSGVIQPLVPTTSPVLEKKKKTQPQVVSAPTPKPQKKFTEGVKKFAVRTAVSFADLITESLDFTTNFIVKNPIFNAGSTLATKTLQKVAPKAAEKQEKQLNKWKDIYTGLAEKPKQAVDRIQQTEYLQPSKEWQKASLKDKLVKHTGETLAVLGPSIIPSFALYAVNPIAGIVTVIGSTANDVKTGAIENGVPENKAEKLGLATGILVGALDRIVPDELFSPSQKAKFIGGFVKRIVPMSIKEAGTEIAQENIQIAAEATFRKDLGWDEVKTRNAMSGLGGLLGGAGATTVVGTINQTFNQDILLETPETKEETKIKEEIVKVPEVPTAKKPSLKPTTEAPKAKKASVKGGVAEGGLYDVKKTVDELAKKSKNPTEMMWRVSKLPEKQRASVAYEIGSKPAGYFDKLYGKSVAQQPLSVKKTAPKPKAPVEVKPKTVSVPREQLPVGEGKKKVSRLEARVTESLDKAPEEVKNLSTYNQMVKKEQISKAVKYVEENPDEAMQVLRGEKEAPKGLLNNSIYVAMEQKAKDDVELARRLASLASTRAGQEISILSEIDPDSPVKMMKEIVDIRVARFKDRFKGKTVKEAQDQVVKNIKKEVKVPSKYDWNSFLNSIEC